MQWDCNLIFELGEDKVVLLPIVWWNISVLVCNVILPLGLKILL